MSTTTRGASAYAQPQRRGGADSTTCLQAQPLRRRRVEQGVQQHRLHVCYIECGVGESVNDRQNSILVFRHGRQVVGQW